MPDKPLSLSATCALLILMVEDREISNPELKEKYGITITGKERAALNQGKFVDSWKKGRSYAHVLTDKGWRHASELFENGLPPGTGFAAAALRAVVSGVQRHIARAGNALADVFAREEDLVPASAEVPAAQPAVPQAPSAVVNAAHPVADVETRIRKAYAELAERPGTWVSLTRLRPLLGDAARDEVDATLRRMIALPDVHIVPFESQKSLSSEDRDAAVVIGDQPKHQILIGA